MSISMYIYTLLKTAQEKQHISSAKEGEIPCLISCSFDHPALSGIDPARPQGVTECRCGKPMENPWKTHGFPRKMI